MRLIIVSVPENKESAQLENFRKEANSAFGCKAALAYPLHVTLRTGALVPDQELEHWLEGWIPFLSGLTPPELTLGRIITDTYPGPEGMKGFAGYEVLAWESLMNIHHRLLEYSSFVKGHQHRFHPHLTLLFEDVEPSLLPEVGTWLEKHQPKWERPFSWLCERISFFFLKDNDWVLARTIPVGNRDFGVPSAKSQP